MIPFVLPLSDPNATLENVGGKGMSLAKLARAGLPVPGGFHITTQAYGRFVADNAIQPRILAALERLDTTDPAALEPVSRLIGGFFAEGRLPADIADAVSAAYTALRPSTVNSGRSTVNGLSSLVRVAVRSSATAEDLPGASFAGQQETYLNIRGAENVLAAVKKCWASLWTARAIAYRARQDIEPDSVALAVVVQELVFAEAAGVMFTANPISGKRDEVMITAAWGLGEAIVAGVVTPDTLTVTKATGRMIRRETAEKQVMTVRTESGTSEVPVPDSQKKKPVLSDAQAAELAGLGAKIEKLYEMPMDIEWTLAAGRFAIVQARPITALPPEWLPPNPKGMYARGSLCEHLPNPVSPLFGTLGLRMVNIPTREIGEMALGPGGGNYEYLTVNGYVFLGMVLTWREWLAMAKATSQLTRSMFKVSHEHWQAGRSELVAAVAAQEAKDVAALTPTELLESARKLMQAIGKFYTVIQASTLPSASSSEIVFTRAYKLVSRKDEPKPEALLLGLETTPLRAEKALFDLGKWVRESQSLRDFVLQTPTEALAAALGADSPSGALSAADWDEFKERFGAYLDEFGHTTYEFDFMNPTPVETPEVSLDALKLYVEGKASDPYARQREAAQLREETLAKIRGRFKLLPNRWFDKAVHWALRVGPDREDSLVDLGRGHTTLRRFFGELGKRFAAHGAIGSQDEIYWLVEDEVSELAARLERGESLPDHAARVAERKAEWHKQMKLIPPAMIPEKSFWAKLLPWNRNATGDVLTGTAGGTGKVTGTARVLFGPEDFGRLKPGEVLVAVTTTPAWTPLFAMAAAIVTDLGGPLSHSSIVAREYGIPAVVATGFATRRIADGQTITVDGGAGTVTLG